MKREALKELRELQSEFRVKEEKAIAEKDFVKAGCYMEIQHALSLKIFKMLENEGVEE